MFIEAEGNGYGGGRESRPRYYVLEGQTPVPVNPFVWAIWFAIANRTVSRTRHRGMLVSTIFLGIDHAFSGPPLLYETMLFSGRTPDASDLKCERAHTWDEAKACHHNMVRAARMLASPRRMAVARKLVRLAKELGYA